MTKMFRFYEDCTCVIYRTDEETPIFTSKDKGVKPLLDYYRLYGPSDTPLIVIDRIVGRGAVILAKLIGAVRITTPIMSEAAYELAKDYGIKTEVTKIVPYIINRAGDGRCPIETAVLGIDDVNEGYKAISETIDLLMGKSSKKSKSLAISSVSKSRIIQEFWSYISGKTVSLFNLQ